jgi:glycosyltransferase involved in cell wall biosynthesis
VSEKILVIIPALNAGPSLGAVVEQARRFMSDVVVIDDGSTDDTASAAKNAGATVLTHPHNRGKGAALKTGFEYALANGYDAVLTIDADGQHLASEMPKFVEARERTGAELIIGSRRHLFAGMLPRRRNANVFSAWAISKAAGLTVDDSQSGFRLYASSLLRRVHIRANGFDAESEVIVRCGRAGIPILMLPIELGFVNGISTSHYRPIADTVKIFWTVTKTRFLP